MVMGRPAILSFTNRRLVGASLHIEGVHKITFKCHTKQDKKVFQYVIVDADKVTNFAIVRQQVM